MLDKDATILIVDDMKMVRSSVKRYLTELGYSKFIEADNGNDAVNKFTTSHVDLIIMDVVMPIMTGIEALQKIREKDVNVHVLMLSSMADEDLVNECKALGIAGYLLKPVNADTGPQKLEAALAQVETV